MEKTVWKFALSMQTKWNKDCKYKLRGQFCGTADEQVMIFELEEPEVLVQEKAEEQFAEETEKKPEEAQKPVKKILYPEAWAYNFGESTNRMVFLQRVSYKGNWDILRPARTVEGMEIITTESQFTTEKANSIEETASNSTDNERSVEEIKRKNRIPFYPKEWKDSFGLPVEEHRKALEINMLDGYAEFTTGK